MPKSFARATLVASLAALGMVPMALEVGRNEAVAEFPDAIHFQLEASSDSPIESVAVEYGTDALVCGEGVTRAIPDDYEPTEEAETEWTWNLRRTGALPPGTEVWWRWRLADADGETLVTPEQSLRFTDDSHDWRSITADDLRLFWYEGDDDFAEGLLSSAERGLETLRRETGVSPQDEVEIYVYAGSGDMQAATLFAPAWSGGLAFANYGRVLLGVAPGELDWGQRVIAHELTHVVVGQHTFSCVNSLPIWLNEGLAMYMEGEMEAYYADVLADAVEADSLLSVRELGSIFSNDPLLASQSYAQSMSLTTFLVEQYGQADMLHLLDAFRDGASEDNALAAVYSVDRDGLEVVWREWAGAAPMAERAGEFGLEPTLAPTLEPIPGPPVAGSPAPLPTPAPLPAIEPDVAASEVSPLLAGGAVALCCVAVVAAVGGGWLVLRRRRKPPVEG